MMQMLPCMLALGLVLAACTDTGWQGEDAAPIVQAETKTSLEKESFFSGQVLESAEGEIHFSYYLPEGYSEKRSYPLVMTMPGYDRMWYGEESAGRNLDWNGVQAWVGQDEDMIVVSAQLTDWGEISAKQAVALTEHFLENFAVDHDRVYAAGFSAGGETMSRAVSMRPELYTAYLHCASQWDGGYMPLAEEAVAVYIFMAEHDEYYGSEKARTAYDGLLAAYQAAGRTGEEIKTLLKLEIPPDEYFHSRGITNYHGGGTLVFDDETALSWILQKRK